MNAAGEIKDDGIWFAITGIEGPIEWFIPGYIASESKFCGGTLRITAIDREARTITFTSETTMPCGKGKKGKGGKGKKGKGKR